MQEFYHKFYSSHLGRDFEMLVFGHSGYPVILFPTSEGRYYECKDYGLIHSAEQFLEEGKIKIYCPDGNDIYSWYNLEIKPKERIESYLFYEKTIYEDVIKFAQNETNNNTVALAGASMGAYYASNIAFKYPNLVGYLFCMSGVFDIREHLEDYYSDEVYFNNPMHYLPNLNDAWYLDQFKWMDIVLGVGKDDYYLNENLFISSVLLQKNIEHQLDVREIAAHDWPTWHHMFPEYLNKISIR